MAATSTGPAPGAGPSRDPRASDVQDNFEAIKTDVAKLADSVRKLASDQFGSAVGDAQDKVQEKVGDLERAVRRNPTQAALIAAGIGFVVGLIMLR